MTVDSAPKIVTNINVPRNVEFFAIVHGFGGNFEHDSKWMNPMRDRLLDLVRVGYFSKLSFNFNAQYNSAVLMICDWLSSNFKGNLVLLVNWTQGAMAPHYFKAAANTQAAGLALAKVMQVLSQQGKISLVHSTLVGFSLGGHVIGFAGRYLPGLRRIIGN